VCSEKKVLTLEDLVERINFQRLLLMDEMNMQSSVPQEPLGSVNSVSKKNSISTVGSSDQSSAEVKSSLHEVHDDISLEEGPSLHEVPDDDRHEEGPSLHEIHDDVSLEEGISVHEVHDDVSHEEGPSVHAVYDDVSHEGGPSLHEDVSHEEECTHHEQGVTQSAEGLRDDKVSLAVRRNSTNHDISEEEIIILPGECEKYRHHKGNRGNEAVNVKARGKRCRKHRKGMVENTIVKEQNLVSEIDQTERGEVEIMREEDTVTVFNEYSFDISVSKAREHSAEMSSGTSSLTSYEGVKVVVSVSELTEKKCLSASPRNGAVILSENSPQEVEKHDIVGRNIGKQKQKQHDTGTRSVKEKPTMTAEGEVERSAKGKLETDLMIERRETTTREDNDMQLDRTKKWQDTVNNNAVTDESLSDRSTSYMSVSDQFVASNIQRLGKVVAAWHDYKKERGSEISEINPWLAGYILRLLAMSRKSVEDLHVSTSDISTSDAEMSADSRRLRETVKGTAKGETEMKQSADNEMYTGLRSEVRAVKQMNTVKDKTRITTDELPVGHKPVTDSRQAHHITLIPQVAGLHSCNEFRESDVKMQSTSTPENLQNSHEITDTEVHGKISGLEDVRKKHTIFQEQLHSSCRFDDNSCEYDMTTPPFTSVISDMSLDEYKTFKFPEIFSDYSEKCSQRISHLAKKIEQIRGEKKKLIESSGSCSSSASSSVNGFDSTSPPELSLAKTCLPSKDKGPVRVKVSDQEAGDVPSVCDAGNQQQVSQNKEVPTSTSFSKLSNGNATREQQQHSQWNHPHVHPPPCLWRHKLQGLVLLHFSAFCLPVFCLQALKYYYY
jgi:hypothetical protein